MLFNYLARRLSLATAQSNEPAASRAENAQSPSLLQIDAQQLAQDRDAVTDLQRDTFQRIRHMQSDLQGVVARHAQARISGLPAEKSALVRIYAGLKVQLAKAEQFHGDLINHQQLLENVAATREFAALRQRLHEGVLAGRGFGELRRLLDATLASELHDRSQTTELLHEWVRYDGDLNLQNQAALADAEDELSALSEPGYQAAVQAQVQPLEVMADEVDQSLKRSQTAFASPQAARVQSTGERGQ